MTLHRLPSDTKCLFCKWRGLDFRYELPDSEGGGDLYVCRGCSLFIIHKHAACGLAPKDDPLRFEPCSEIGVYPHRSMENT